MNYVGVTGMCMDREILWSGSSTVTKRKVNECLNCGRESGRNNHGECVGCGSTRRREVEKNVTNRPTKLNRGFLPE